MPLIIDGYNLLHASGILGRGRGPGHLERARNALLNYLAHTLEPAELRQTAVVFDAHDPPWGLSRELHRDGMTIYFSSRYEDADSLIEELILDHTAPKRLVVVSSDHRLHRAAKRRKATAIDSDVWFAERNRARQNAGTSTVEAAKPAEPGSEVEVEYWLRHFGLAEER